MHVVFSGYMRQIYPSKGRSPSGRSTRARRRRPTARSRRRGSRCNSTITSRSSTCSSCGGIIKRQIDTERIAVVAAVAVVVAVAAAAAAAIAAAAATTVAAVVAVLLRERSHTRARSGK